MRFLRKDHRNGKRLVASPIVPRKAERTTSALLCKRAHFCANARTSEKCAFSTLSLHQLQTVSSTFLANVWYFCNEQFLPKRAQKKTSRKECSLEGPGIHYNTNTNRFQGHVVVLKNPSLASLALVIWLKNLVVMTMRHVLQPVVTWFANFFGSSGVPYVAVWGVKKHCYPRPQLNINRYEAEHHCRMYESRFCMIIDDTWSCRELDVNTKYTVCKDREYQITSVYIYIYLYYILYLHFFNHNASFIES